MVEEEQNPSLQASWIPKRPVQKLDRSHVTDGSCPWLIPEESPWIYKTRSSSREVTIRVQLFSVAYFSRLEPSQQKKKNGEKGHLAAGPRIYIYIYTH